METLPNLQIDQPCSLFNSTCSNLQQIYHYLPGSSFLLRYIKNSYQNDPVRVVLELFLVFFALKYLLSKKYNIENNDVQLTEEEVDELVDDWQPEPLVPSLSNSEREMLDNVPITVGPPGTRQKMRNGKTLVNMAAFNFLGFLGNETLKTEAVRTLRKYGVGSCGPPGFYGTLDVHKLLERDIANFLGTEDAIIYSQGFSTVSSVIPAYAKRGDMIVCDEGANFAIQKGIQISRSRVRYFKHNDMNDLERVLENIIREDAIEKRPLTRRFIVTEGLSLNYGDIVPLKKLVELKHAYKFRIILDESLSFGVFGKRGAGVTEHFGVPIEDIDLLIGSMCHALTSSGGFCAGSKEIIDHQRLSGLAYTFSASLPAILAVCAREGLSILQKQSQVLATLRNNVATFRSIAAMIPAISLGETSDASPILHIRIHNDVVDKLDLSPKDQEKKLQEIVHEVNRDGFLITRAMYVPDQELFLPKPSIRICISAAHTKREVEKAANSIRAAVHKVLGKCK
ncbi:PLP-dependent transferase [Basidiobolus meristosporus CBS 931.73]|uniref:serine C-palmitoyltransferase n=1 Tax=Basidiobolus meristosporus CBS 931.73 TaxID=1314790 RepID=A0A1Y1XTI4_9FUNG|nr:PLP-dependent transferase [Basidiobolus meristosporus CBS 931.73]|eukprot:ORX89023.1 PLP-dependent transferase [Basidiobolus meristosporus CBS 931.73]